MRYWGGKFIAVFNLSQNNIISPKVDIAIRRTIPKISKNRFGGDFCSRL